MAEKFRPGIIYTTTMVARRTGWSANTIRLELSEGRLFGRRLSERGHWKIDGADLNAWWERMENSADPYALKEIG